MTQILKILNGKQAGVDARLPPGDYAIGSGDDDDFQLHDISLRNGHLRLRVTETSVEIAGGTGSARIFAGEEHIGDVEAGEDSYVMLEPLAIVEAGASRFATGPVNAQWHTLQEGAGTAGKKKKAPPRPAAASTGLGSFRSWLIIGQAGLIAALVYVLVSLGGPQETVTTAEQQDPQELVGGAIDRFDFTQHVAWRREVDGMFHVEGFVGTPAERRALVQALTETRAPMQLNVFVREDMQREARAVLDRAPGGEDLSVGVAPDGVVLISGLHLDPAGADDAVLTLQRALPEARAVNSDVTTIMTVLSDTEALLGQYPRIAESVTLQRTGTPVQYYIEAIGIVDRADRGEFLQFLRGYAREIASIVPMRSYVVLDDGSGNYAPTSPVVIGEDAQIGAENERQLEPAAIRDADDAFANHLPQPENDPRWQGLMEMADRYGLGEDVLRWGLVEGNVEVRGDLPAAAQANWEAFRSEFDRISQGRVGLASYVTFSEGEGGGTSSGDGSTVPYNAPTASGTTGDGRRGTPRTGEGPRAGTNAGFGQRVPANRARGLQRNAQTAEEEEAERRAAAEALRAATDRMLVQWQTSTGTGDANMDERVRTLLEEWASNVANGTGREPGSGEDMATTFLELFLRKEGSTQPCWPNASVTQDNLAVTIFWLDLLHREDAADLAQMSPNDQVLIGEAALSPSWLRECVAAMPQPLGDILAAASLYLRDAERNPQAPRRLLRGFPTAGLTPIGANLSGNRYVRLSSGELVIEGAASTGGQRVLSIGEFGILLGTPEGSAVDFYDGGLSWYVFE
ncbi:MAG: FHA domain-containing protein [Pseudomonadota bacterium]